MDIPVWRQRLRGALAREGRSPSARWLQLATVAPDNSPRVRTLVFRSWAGPHEMDLFTDQRGDKIGDLNHQPQIELCWLLRKACQQYRLRGCMRQLSHDVDAAAIELAWQSLSSRGRALWSWPPPGAPFRPDAEWANEVPPETTAPDHFLVLRLTIERVELLNLRCHPHQRLLWKRDDSWREQRLNP